MVVNKLKELRSGGAEDGFTLIELMIVVVIIGILAAIAIPIFLNQQKSAIAASIKSDVRNTNTNVVTYLVKDPTATDLESLSGPDSTDPIKLIQTDGNRVDIASTATAGTGAGWGAWDEYVVIGSNFSALGGANAAANAYVFDSTTGTYTGTGIFA